MHTKNPQQITTPLKNICGEGKWSDTAFTSLEISLAYSSEGSWGTRECDLSGCPSLPVAWSSALDSQLEKYNSLIFFGNIMVIPDMHQCELKRGQPPPGAVLHTHDRAEKGKKIWELGASEVVLVGMFNLSVKFEIQTVCVGQEGLQPCEGSNQTARRGGALPPLCSPLVMLCWVTLAEALLRALQWPQPLRKAGVS